MQLFPLLAVFLLLSESVQLLQLQVAQDVPSNSSGNGEVSRHLSRKKRFLIFPEGSSLQLVYCLTIPTVAMADIFSYGWTAALAWELPHDPFVLGRRPADFQHRIDTPNNYETSTKKPQSYHNKQTMSINRFRIPPSTYSTILQLLNKKIKYSTIKLAENELGPHRQPFQSYGDFKEHAYYGNRYDDVVTSYHDPMYREVHRRTRRDLFKKIERFFSMQQKDGKSCLLKAICEVTQLPKGKKKGSFMQEVIRVIFRVKEFHNPDGENDEYDSAANEEHDCNKMYPTCDNTIWTLI